MKNIYAAIPDNNDIMYEFYVKKKIDIALKSAEEGRVVSHEEVKKRFLITRNKKQNKNQNTVS
ncbi:hypothetical protein BEH94_05930 [Candidatus Altiarchaeales archaeon WOR_SM1_SCG]|nr:hypothetical protein BEH94_05930 [Candidatus Altiarchaeales archaeon WOR_SM1_SCG]